MAYDFQIRQAGPADTPDLAQVAQRTFPLACPPATPAADIQQHISNELSERAFLAHMDSPVTEFQVAVASDGQIIGYLMLVVTAAGAPNLPGTQPLEVRRIYVDEAWQGRGVGAALMDLAVVRARNQQLDCLWLGTNQENHTAVAFYRRLGFEHVGTRTFQVGCSVECDFVLARSLATVTQ
ncbi:MAG: GNAT family N-acetyltransferase [Actinomycetia bacterium]|nr:GNAT family N-acetyltransferase [Actinomycetes bacterium]MCH9800616.1 GNAT family N-acetyltransferase [Actinomycetes bacterium]